MAEGRDTVIPNYNYTTCKRDEPGIYKKATPLILFEGIFALLDQDIIDKYLDFNIFVTADDDLRLSRRLQRDIVERGRSLKGVLQSYHAFVKPAFTEFIKPTMKQADIIVPRMRKAHLERNNIAIEFIAQNL